MKKEKLIQLLHQQIGLAKAERQAARFNPRMFAARVVLKDFQAARLARTHADLLAAEDTHDAAVFFLNDLYSSEDLTQRDSDLERIVPTLDRLLSYRTLETITQAIILDALSESLDTQMAARLGESFTEDEYLMAYRHVMQRGDRERQLGLVQALGLSLSELVHIPFLAATLVIMRGPAKLARLSSLQQFLERGFTTFKGMSRPTEFVATIVAREGAILDRIYRGWPDPFSLPAGYDS